MLNFTQVLCSWKTIKVRRNPSILLCHGKWLKFDPPSARVRIQPLLSDTSVASIDLREKLTLINYPVSTLLFAWFFLASFSSLF